MCTIGFIEPHQLIFKNRDKTSPVEEEIINDGNIIACRTKGERHFSCGFNRSGCGFVTASVDQFFWPHSGDIYSPKQQYPVSLHLSETLADIKDISEWEKFFADQDRIFQGANLIIFDQNQVKFVELFANNAKSYSKTGKTIRANHFDNVSCSEPNGRRTGELNTFERNDLTQSYVNNSPADLNSLHSFLARPVTKADKPSCEQPGLWMSDISGGLITVSVNIIDRANLTFYHTPEPNGTQSCHKF